MTGKKITIDLEAYNLLVAEKRGKESFSRVIKRLLGKKCTADNLLRNLHKIDLSDSTLDKTEELIFARRGSMTG